MNPAPSNFAFLRAEWPDLAESPAKAEIREHSELRTAGFSARSMLELAVS